MIVSKKYLTFMLLSMGIMASNKSFCVPVDTMLKLGAYGATHYISYKLLSKLFIQQKSDTEELLQKHQLALEKNLIAISAGNTIENKLQSANAMLQSSFANRGKTTDTEVMRHALSPLILYMKCGSILRLDASFDLYHIQNIPGRILTQSNTILLDTMQNHILGTLFHEIHHKFYHNAKPFACKIQLQNNRLKCLYHIGHLSIIPLALLTKKLLFAVPLINITILAIRLHLIQTLQNRYARDIEIACDTLSELKIENNNKYYGQWMLYKYLALRHILNRCYSLRKQHPPCNNKRSTHPCIYSRIQKILAALAEIETNLQEAHVPIDTSTQDMKNVIIKQELPPDIRYGLINNIPIDSCTPYTYVQENHG